MQFFKLFEVKRFSFIKIGYYNYTKAFICYKISKSVNPPLKKKTNRKKPIDVSLSLILIDMLSWFSLLDYLSYIWMGKIGQVGTNLTQGVVGQLLTQLSDTFSMWIWQDKGRIRSYSRLNVKTNSRTLQYCISNVTQTEHRPVSENLICLQCKRVACKSWRTPLSIVISRCYFPQRISL